MSIEADLEKALARLKIAKDEAAELRAKLEEANNEIATIHAAHNQQVFRAQQAEDKLATAERDKERLEWLLAYITQNGATSLIDLEWTVIRDEDDDISDRSDVVFDRAAIDKAKNKTHEQ